MVMVFYYSILFSRSSNNERAPNWLEGFGIKAAARGDRVEDGDKLQECFQEEILTITTARCDLECTILFKFDTVVPIWEPWKTFDNPINGHHIKPDMVPSMVPLSDDTNCMILIRMEKVIYLPSNSKGEPGVAAGSWNRFCSTTTICLLPMFTKRWIPPPKYRLLNKLVGVIVSWIGVNFSGDAFVNGYSQTERQTVPIHEFQRLSMSFIRWARNQKAQRQLQQPTVTALSKESKHHGIMIRGRMINLPNIALFLTNAALDSLLGPLIV